MAKNVAPGARAGLALYDSKGRCYDEEEIAAIREELEHRAGRPEGMILISRDLAESCIQMFFLVSDGKENVYASHARDLMAARKASPAPARFTRQDVTDAYATLRAYNCNIPDEHLDNMRDVLRMLARPD